MTVYTVLNLATKERGMFTQARDVAIFMWGRDLKRHAIFKNGREFAWTDGNLAKFEKALERA